MATKIQKELKKLSEMGRGAFVSRSDKLDYKYCKHCDAKNLPESFICWKCRRIL